MKLHNYLYIDEYVKKRVVAKEIMTYHISPHHLYVTHYVQKDKCNFNHPHISTYFKIVYYALFDGEKFKF